MVFQLFVLFCVCFVLARFFSFLAFGLEPRELLPPEKWPRRKAHYSTDGDSNTNSKEHHTVVTKVEGKTPPDKPAKPKDDLNKFIGKLLSFKVL